MQGISLQNVKHVHQHIIRLANKTKPFPFLFTVCLASLLETGPLHVALFNTLLQKRSTVHQPGLTTLLSLILQGMHVLLFKNV